MGKVESLEGGCDSLFGRKLRIEGYLWRGLAPDAVRSDIELVRDVGVAVDMSRSFGERTVSHVS
jgi:hypothetical protein